MLYQTENPHGGDIYEKNITLDFSANINPLGTPESVISAMREALLHVDRYPDPYCRKLVSAIAGYEGVPESFILCGSGAAELIYAFADAVRAKTALEAAPTFSEYALSLSRFGGRTERFLLSEARDFLPDERFVARIKEVRPDTVYVCNPNNPTGRLWNKELLLKTLDACEETGSRLFADECFLELTGKEESLKNRLFDHPKLFILKAFTKSYGMAGVRLGYALCSDSALLKAMSETVQPWNVSLIAQEAGVAALKEKAHVRSACTMIEKERVYLTESLRAEGFYTVPSDVNFILFKDSREGKEPLDISLAKKGIAIRNCGNFPGLEQGNWYRIAVRTPEEDRRLMEAVRDLR